MWKTYTLTLKGLLNYARSEFFIASAIYYYYLQQEQQSLEAINEIKVDEALESDTRCV